MIVSPTTRPHPPTAIVTSRHGGGGCGVYLLLSRTTFDVARIFLALHVFLCHAFFPVHHWYGFLSVSGFFFISGYGISVSCPPSRALLRLPRFLAVMFFFSLIYYFVYGVFFYPTCWFLISYSIAMLLYRFLGFSYPLLSIVYVLYLLFLHYFVQCDYVWVFSSFCFFDWLVFFS